MAAEQGCLTLTAQQVAARSVSVTPAVAPAHGSAHCARALAARTFERPLKATVVGADLVIKLTGFCRAGDTVCWTSYGA